MIKLLLSVECFEHERSLHESQFKFLFHNRDNGFLLKTTIYIYACISIIIISFCLFENHLGQSYPTELEIKDTTESNTFASFLDLFLPIESGGQFFTSLYLERNESNFHITSLPFPTSMHIPFSPAYGVLSHNSSDMPGLVPLINVFILKAERRLSNNLLGQGYVTERLKSSLRKFYGRYGDLFKRNEVPFSRMLHNILYDDHMQ